MNIPNKNQEEKEEKPEENELQKLTGTHSPTAVSDVAKGGKAETLDEHNEVYNTEWIARLHGKEDTGCKDINEAYAQLFESLSIIARN